MSKSKKPFFTSENLHQRFTRAKITENPKVGFIQAYVTNPDIPIKDLRISSQLDNPHRSDIDWKHYKKGGYIDVFIHHETGRKSGFADAGKMASLKNNPWSKKSLHRGDTVEGIVSSYFDNADGVYAVLVTLEKNLTTEESWLYQKKKAPDGKLQTVQFDAISAFLHRNDTPLAPDQLLHKHLHIGDRVRAVIVDLDEDKLNITIGVNEYLTLRTKSATTKK